MRKIFLPTLKKIKINNFTLYPNGLNFNYDFINGVNVIIGGNGMGKTTFVNIIKYSIIGHYKKDFDYTRSYNDRKIEKRILNPINYYKNRQDTSISTDSKPTVTIEFDINQTTFELERCLETISLNYLKINNAKLDGKLITQNKYEELNDETKEEYLLKIYEKEIEKEAGLSFDDLIFFVNEILFFGEDHKTILWSDGKLGNDVQKELFNKYFNSPNLDLSRRNAERQAKYYDSQSRHRSEDIRAIKKVLEKVSTKNNDGIDTVTLNNEILETKKELEIINGKIFSKQKERVSLENDISLSNKKVNEISLKEGELEKQLKVAENKLFENKYVNLHKNYDLYYQSIKTNQICPLCSKEVDDKYTKHKIESLNNCILCDQEINEIEKKELDENFKSLNDQLLAEHKKIRFFQKEINSNEKKLDALDQEFRVLTENKRTLSSKLRNLEFTNSNKSTPKPDKLQDFYDEIEALEIKKDDFLQKSKLEKIKATEISNKITGQISNVTSKFSMYFSEFAGEFLGVKCSLTYDDLGDGNKRFYPVIDGKIRQSEEELSESQRFFIDHSFRMSILSYFYTKPTFYIIETPDSSLDISYEKNAANVFLKFLEKENSLILTTNLNNSAFLNHLIELSKNKISTINLIDIGKQSFIQKSSNSLSGIYSKIKSLIK